jgi:hypothetical protein
MLCTVVFKFTDLYCSCNTQLLELEVAVRDLLGFAASNKPENEDEFFCAAMQQYHDKLDLNMEFDFLPLVCNMSLSIFS